MGTSLVQAHDSLAVVSSFAVWSPCRSRCSTNDFGIKIAQVGDASPDVDPALLKAAFNVTQSLIADGCVLAGHDVSDGGLAVALLEMAFAGNCGIQVSA